MSDINFETDQEEVLDRTANIDKLANKIKEMQATLTEKDNLIINNNSLLFLSPHVIS